MKLYIWYNVFSDYAAGVAFCMAHSLEEAFAIMKGQLEDWEFEELRGAPEVHDEPFGAHVHGGG